MPTPSSRIVSACSKSSQPMPRARNISAVVRPPIPPPTTIAFIAVLHLQFKTPRDGLEPSHGGLLGGKRLCALQLELGPCLRLSLNFQLFELLPIPLAVPENLLLAGQVLRRAEHPLGPIPSRGLQREARVDQMRPPKGYQISAAGSQNGVDLVGRSDVADAHGGDAGFIANLIGEWRLKHAAIYRTRVAHRLTGGNIDKVDAGFSKGASDLDRVIAVDPSVRPVGSGYAYRHRLMRRPYRSHGLKNLERIPQAVCQRTAITICAPVGQRRDETCEQVTVGAVQLQHIE